MSAINQSIEIQTHQGGVEIRPFVPSVSLMSLDSRTDPSLKKFGLQAPESASKENFQTDPPTAPHTLSMKSPQQHRNSSPILTPVL